LKTCRNRPVSEAVLAVLPLTVAAVCLAGLLGGCGTSPEAEAEQEGTAATGQQAESDPGDAEASSGGDGGVSVPFTLTRRKFMEVNVRVNGGSGQTFLFFPTFRRSVVLRSGSDGEGTSSTGLNGSGPSTADGSGRHRTVDRLQVGSFTARDVEVLHISRKALLRLSPILKSDQTTYAGVIGQDVLQGTEITLDYPGKTCTIRRVREPAGQKRPVTVAPGRLPYRMTEAAVNRKLMVIQAGVNGSYRGQFALMPGMPVNLLDRSFVKKWDLSLTSSERLESVYGLRSSSYRFLEIDRFWCGGRTFKKVLFRVSNQLKRNMSLSAEGILGYIFLKNKVVRIHFPQRWVEVRQP